MIGHRIQQEAICYQWFKQRLILSVSEPSISQRSRIKEDTIEPSVTAREFNLKAYAAITWHNDPASPDLEPSLADHRSQAAHTATLLIAPLGQATVYNQIRIINQTTNEKKYLFCNVNLKASRKVKNAYVFWIQQQFLWNKYFLTGTIYQAKQV